MARSLRKRGSRSSKPKKGGASLNTISILAFVLFSAILAIAVLVGQMGSLSVLQVQKNAVLDAVVERSANSIMQSVSSYTEALHAVAADPKTRQLIQSGDALTISLREAELKEIFPSALRVRLLKAKLSSPDKSSEPHLGFACLDLQREGEKTMRAPPVEVHVMGTPQQHIDIMQPVLDETGATVIGHVQLALKVELIQQWVQQAAGEGYIVLRQKIGDSKTVPLAQAGNRANKAEAEVVTTTINNTAWNISVWLPGVVRVLPFNLEVLIVIGLGILLAGLMVISLRSSLSNAIRTDLESFMHLEANFLQGKQRHEYFLKMKEFRDAAKRLDQLPRNANMERERDDDPDAVNVTALSNEMDPLYISKDAMEVEELAEADVAKSFQQQAPSPQQPQVVPAPQAQQPAPASGSATVGLPPPEIFKAYDIRGIVGQTLTVQHALLIGRALGSEALNRGLSKIVFARDGRLSGPELGVGLVKGLQAAGLDVVDVGMVPTPVLYYAAAELTEGTGVMLTGSHNPPNYNGLKMVLGGETLSGDAIQALRQRIEKNDFSQGSGNYQTQAVTKNYIDRITSDVRLKRKLKVVIDCGNGVAGAVAPDLFKALGCELVELFTEVDGNFPNHHPDPSKPENLKDLIENVRTQDADVGFAFDGDGDRLGVVSSDGSIIWPDRLMMLFATDVLTRNQGAQIIYDVKCSTNLTRVILDKGGEPVMWKTGHSLIKAKMKQSGALLAGEMSGHIFFKERWYGFDDALYSGARLLEILAGDARQPREVFASLPNAVNTPELNITMPEGEHHKFMDKMLSQAEFGDANVVMIDGVRADFEDGWGLVRASNTTPCLVLRFEGKDKDAMIRIQQKFKKVMQEIEPTLQIPF